MLDGIEFDVDIEEFFDVVEVPEGIEAFLAAVEYAFFEFFVKVEVVLEVCFFDFGVEIFQGVEVAMVLLDKVFLVFEDFELIFGDGD